MRKVYLDYNATTPLEPEVWQAMGDVWAEPSNASSVHRFGRDARRLVEEARISVARLVGAEGKRLVFTSSGTEANNLALRGVPDVSVCVSAVEHASVKQALPGVDVLPVDEEGLLDLFALEEYLARASGRVLVSVMLANNETGVIQPLREIVAIARKYNALVHTDAVQAVGKISVDMNALGVDMMTVSAHKLGGAQGAAALIVDKSVPLSALQRGGGQEQGLRAGTENVAAIHGFGVAAKLVSDNLHQNAAIRALRERLEERMLREAPQARIFGAGAPRLPNTLCVAMPGVPAEVQLIHFDLSGFAVSAGAACSSGRVQISPVLLAMGVSEEIAQNAIRISLGVENTEEELALFFKEWKDLYQRVGHQHYSREAA